MNKQLEEGKRLAEEVNDYMILDAETIECMKYHTPEYLLSIYAHIEKLEAENKRFRDALNKIENEPYTDKKHWQEMPDGKEMSIWPAWARVTARLALKESE